MKYAVRNIGNQQKRFDLDGTEKIVWWFVPKWSLES